MVSSFLFSFPAVLEVPERAFLRMASFSGGLVYVGLSSMMFLSACSHLVGALVDLPCASFLDANFFDKRVYSFRAASPKKHSTPYMIPQLIRPTIIPSPLKSALRHATIEMDKVKI